MTTATNDGVDSPIEKLWKLAWWALMIRGLAAIVFGAVAMAWPTNSILALVIVYGAYVLVDGIFSIIAVFGSHSGERWWQLLSGLFSVAAGVMAFIWPGLTALALVMIIGVWSIVRGLVEIMAAVRLRKVIPNEWMLIAAGIISVLLGIVLIASPLVGALALIWALGIWAIAFGLLMVGLAFKVRSHKPV